MIFRFFYSLVGYLVLPILVIFLNIPKKHKPAYGKRFFELLGFYKYNSSNLDRIWIHTVSVGETIAAIPFLKKYHKNHPETEIIVTTTTTTGAQQLQKLDFVKHLYAPLDYPHAIRLFLNKIKPKALIVMERELWPNWLNQCQKRHIPVFLINARLSEKSFNQYNKLPRLFNNLIGSKISLIMCQNDTDEQRYQKLGIKNTVVTGSMKYDLEINETLCNKGKEFKKSQGDRPIWVAASTHEGEEETILKIHSEVIKEIPNALLILIPRHPQRFDNVALTIQQNGFRMSRKSVNENVNETTQVYLGDTLGEMMFYLTASDIVFMGGSISNIGGHNPIEPAAVAKPIIIGHYYYNFEEIVQKLYEAKAIEIIEDPINITQSIVKYLNNKELAGQTGLRAKKFVESNIGAVTKTLEYTDQFLASNSEDNK